MKFSDRIKNKLDEFTKESEKRSDSSIFNDPVAGKTDWTPLKRGGSSFRSHKFQRPETFRVEFRCSLGIYLFGGAFMLLGVGLPLGMAVSQTGAAVFSDLLHLLSFDLLMFFIMGIVFFAVGLFLVLMMTRPVVFDKQAGWYWKGRKIPDPAAESEKLKKACPLNRIHALQIISEYVRNSKSSYYSYELNLVLEDGRRLNVVDHGNLTALREDAQTLASFLGKPLWEQTKT